MIWRKRNDTLKLQEEAQGRTLWRTRLGRGYEPVVRQTADWTIWYGFRPTARTRELWEYHWPSRVLYKNLYEELMDKIMDMGKTKRPEINVSRCYVAYPTVHMAYPVSEPQKAWWYSRKRNWLKFSNDLLSLQKIGTGGIHYILRLVPKFTDCPSSVCPNHVFLVLLKYHCCKICRLGVAKTGL